MNAIDRLLAVIGYPADEVVRDGTSVVLSVDGRKVRVDDLHGRLVLSVAFGDPSEEALQRLAQYAAGRMLREEAVLAWDPVRRELILWQEVPTGAGDDRARLAFELFCTSCEWWADRCAEARIEVPEAVFRP